MVHEYAAEAAVLAERFQRGDQDCLRQILRGVCPAICRALESKHKFRYLTRSEIEDAVAESLFNAWRLHGDYDPARAPLYRWLLAFADHAASNLARSPDVRVRAMQAAIQLDEFAAPVSSPRTADEPDAEAARRAKIVETVRAALAALPERVGLVIKADAYSSDGHACTAALAEEIGVAAATVRDYRRRGRQKLKVKL